MDILDLDFAPIDLSAHADVALSFRADSFVCSYGSDELFVGTDGQGHQRYLARLSQQMSAMPGSCVHVWWNEEIVGQVEVDRFAPDPRIGYVSLYYLAPAYRHRGLGQQLDAHAMAFLMSHGFDCVRLSVSVRNAAAMRFYSKHGWRDLGPRDGQPTLHLMERQFPSDPAAPAV